VFPALASSGLRIDRLSRDPRVVHFLYQLLFSEQIGLLYLSFPFSSWLDFGISDRSVDGWGSAASLGAQSENELAHLAIRLFRVAVLRKVPVVFAHPVSSHLWRTAECQLLLSLSGVQRVSLSCCDEIDAGNPCRAGDIFLTFAHFSLPLSSSPNPTPAPPPLPFSLPSLALVLLVHIHPLARLLANHVYVLPTYTGG
jgi:hypothetical protein